VFGGYPVTGGFSRTAVNDAAGARTPLASIVTAVLVLVTIAVFTPLLSSLPNAVLGAIIVVAVIGLVDVREMRHISKVKPTDVASLSVAFVATLVLGIDLGIAVAVVASMLVVFARMSNPHTAVLGQVEGTTNYRNVERFPEVTIRDGIRVIRIDAAISFVNAIAVKRMIIREADALVMSPRALVLDASGINDLDATGADMLSELLPELEQRGVHWYLTEVKGPVRDVLRRAGLWDRWAGRIHASTSDAVDAVLEGAAAPVDLRRQGIDERHTPATSDEPTHV
jgi:SulP family sulfate permease